MQILLMMRFPDTHSFKDNYIKQSSQYERMKKTDKAEQSINSPHDPHQASGNKSSSKRCNGWRLVFSKGRLKGKPVHQ